MLSPRPSCEVEAKRDIPSFIEARPPLILNPFMRPKLTKGKKLFTDEMDMEYSEFEEHEEPELVQIYVRLKPCKAPSIEVHSERSLITSLNTTTAGHGRRTQHNVPKMYTFSHIFGPDSQQKEIFERVVKDNLKKLPDGNSFTLLTYGASGSGKTFTLMGTVKSPGLVPRSLEYVFKLVEAQQHPLYKPDEKGAYKLTNAEQDYELKVVRQLRKLSGNLPEYRDRYRRMSAGLDGDLTNSNIDLASRRSHYVWVSFIEIYNEAVYDLLMGDRRNAAKLAIREDASGNVYVKGAMQAFVRSCDEAYDVLVAGKLNLQVAATGIHAQSSRSHCIFTITMLTDTENGMRSACVRLCDLAGCERAARTRNTGARMQESRAINASLHVLERCLHTLRRKRTTAVLVPYRESKLTRILGAGLSGTRGEAVSMVVTLNPSAEYANENKHVLQLAAIAKDIPISDTLVEYPSSTESSSRDTTIIGYTSFEVMQLRAENERLLFELKQAQARNKELRACMDEKQAAHDKMLWEVLDETKAMYRDHYEAQIKALQDKMDAMEEEYECRLRELSLDNPSQRYRDRIAELKKTIAILEKKIFDQEEELKSSKTCMNNNDADKAEEEFTESNNEDEDIISLNDSDNDCLIPTLNQKEIKHVQKIRESITEVLKICKRASGIKESYSEESDVEDPKVSDHDHDAYLTSESLNTSDTSDIDNAGFSTVKKASSRFNDVVDGVNNDVATVTNQEIKTPERNRQHSRETYCVPKSVDDIATVTNQEKEIPERNRHHGRETYCVPKSVDDIASATNQEKEIPERNRQHSRETYCVPKSVDDIATVTNQEKEIPERNRHHGRETYCVPKSVDDIASATNQEKEIPERNRQHSRETYCVPKSVDDIATVTNQEKEIPERNRQHSRETYCVPTPVNDIATMSNQEKEIPERNRQLSRETYCVPKSVDDVVKETNQENESLERKRQLSRETYCVLTPVNDVVTMSNQEKEIPERNQQHSRETYCVPMSEVLNTSKDKLHNEIPKSLKYDIVKDIDVSKPNERLKKSLNNMVDIVKTVEPKKLSHVTSKILGLVKQLGEGDSSLLQFERLEMESSEIIDDDKKIVIEEFYNIKPTKENRIFFGDDCLDKNPETPATVVKAKDKKVFENPNVEKSNLDKNSKTTIVPPVEKTYFFGESITKQTDCVKKNISSRAQNSIYIFEEFDSPQVNKLENTESRATLGLTATLDQIGLNIDSVNVIESNDIKNTNKAVTSQNEAKAANIINSDLKMMSIDNAIEKETLKIEIITANENKLDDHPLEILNSDESQSQANCTKTNNTTVEFENIYKDISASRATEFDLLISQESIEENQNKTESVESLDLKYNLRHKPYAEKAKTERKRGKKKVGAEEILLESVSKCESSPKPTRRNLRLRRQKTTEEATDLEDIGRKGKLEDIGNLQVQFSDVIMGLPAPLTTSKDIPSPEKLENEENSPPKQGIQSCPAKSITRSRRKLFTPRAEPLDESLGVAADSDDKVRVPRPSYHRPRARRKL
ncbi:kinesin-like protein KIF20B isoform X2 [Maniola jurtina]|uniref:kinesin-like protein KIF20B isoform X2 n=1 Tax=Maniola jurtina TaxID=191418 RepID=UPI001E68C57B|nr:kinesin-like protein KIF20B isoform X2 [Maniola jurtina]